MEPTTDPKYQGDNHGTYNRSDKLKALKKGIGRLVFGIIMIFAGFYIVPFLLGGVVAGEIIMVIFIGVVIIGIMALVWSITGIVLLKINPDRGVKMLW